MRLFDRSLGYLLLSFGLFAFGQAPEVQTFDISVHLHFEESKITDAHKASSVIDSSHLQTIIWLEPEDKKTNPLPSLSAESYTMVQQNRQFSPHLLVIPLGSTVSFPNRDPFFHNVFSLFNGKRFDLGLYQSGQARTVTFNRAGVSYIFCNIHPEMAAVIITLDTPYYAAPNPHGDLVFHGVREGTYTLHVWSENTSPEELASLRRTVTINSSHTKLEDIVISVSKNALENHTNKFGLPYDTHTASPY
jgi:plastocyanin